MSAEEHTLAATEKHELLRSCGKPINDVRVKITNKHGHELAANDIGEILIQSPSLMQSYWRRPDATAEVIKNGWYHTGDMGYVNDEGFLYISDRLKDMIISGGENIYPTEIESVLIRHTCVQEVAIIGIPNEKWGEEVKAIVVLKEGMHVSDEELIEYCRGELAGYKLPRSVDFISLLPRNPSGKVLKTELRRSYWQSDARKI